MPRVIFPLRHRLRVGGPGFVAGRAPAAPSTGHPFTAWALLRTWTDGEVVTAAMMNAYLRDPLNVLKTTRDAAGRITDISSASFADLNGAAITGVVFPAALAGNAFIAGTSAFNQGATTRFVVPVGTDKWTGTKGIDAAGVWVETTDLHHIAQDFTQEWRYTGTYVSTPGGAVIGSVWVAGSSLFYIDASGDKRRVDYIPDSVHADHSDVPHTDLVAQGGSAWVRTYVHWVAEAGTSEQPGHADLTHADHVDHSDHTDHGDSGAHTDSSSHVDDGHSDHGDVTIAHVDVHADHSDVGHADGHGDHTDHTDHSDHADHSDHGDSGAHSDHTDHSDNTSTQHSDAAADSRPVTVP